MTRPYSLDLRERVVSAAESGESCRSVAARFGVAVSTVVKWSQRYRATGGVVPGQMGGHKPKAIRGEHHDWLVERIKDGAFTLHGLVAELAGRGLKVDYHTMWDFVHAQNMSFKKRRWSPASARVPMSPADAGSG